MSLSDPMCYPQPDGRYVCVACFKDSNIKFYINSKKNTGACDFCAQTDTNIADVGDVAEHIKSCLRNFNGLAVEQLPYISAEGGYQGSHWDTHELLSNCEDLDLPNDNGTLFNALVELVGDEVWCEYDWLADADFDKALGMLWREFSYITKYRRRFFFFKSQTENPSEILTSVGTLTIENLLPELVKKIEDLSIIKTWPVGTHIIRGREVKPPKEYKTALELGPPPEDKCTQANRMSPPGISVMYAALDKTTALKEIQSKSASLGTFELRRSARIIDLSSLPIIPGLFSGKPRDEILATSFLHIFAKEISKPITRDDDRFHIEYVPSQIITEFFRDYKFEGGYIDGICFPSSVHSGGRNVVLFATPENLINIDGSPSIPKSTTEKWLQLINVE
jgi:hypothetical protein